MPCPRCGSQWEDRGPDGGTCPEHGFITREEIEGKGPSFHSAAYIDGLAAERNEPASLKFRTAKELGESVPLTPEWIAGPWVAKGALTEVDGKVKASGKTTFLTHLCAAVLEGREFLGTLTFKTPIVFLTEQGNASFIQALKRAGLLERADLYILSWHESMGIEWEEVVAQAVAKCLEVGACLLCVDTLPQFAGIEGEGENLSGEALKALRPLQAGAFAHNIGVAFSRHERKSGGEVGDSGRGSSAYAGGADIVLSLRRREVRSMPNVRVIHALSRFDETPPELVIELVEGGYRVLGNEHSLAMHEARKKLVESLPRTEEHAMPLDEVVELVHLGRTTVQEALKAGREDGETFRSGKGTKGDPYKYWAA